jgi:dissimilatory sulfite reductase alpha subunit
MEQAKTPMLDELEKGDWPSFVSEIKRAAVKNKAAQALLEMLESSYKENIGHWKHGGIVGVKGYGGGVVGRYCDAPEKYPDVKEFHTVRVCQPAGFFYTTQKLRQLADVWDKYGSGLYNMHGSTGDIILLGTTTPNLQPCVDELGEIGFDLGGSGGCLRSLGCCVGQARCEKACIDSMDIIRDLTLTYQAEIHRPAWPYKIKIKVSGCPNDCAAASARSDVAVIGVWRDTLRIDNAAVRKEVDGGYDIINRVVRKCPSEALNWDMAKKELTVSAEDCVHCMNCINMMPDAISIGRERGATILIGGKATVVKGSMIGWVLVPFMKMEPPYTEFKELFGKITEWWDEHGKNRERVGELIDRLGYATFLEAMGLKPLPQMVRAPRSNPYIFWKKEEVK